MTPEKQRIAIAEACGWRHKTGSWNRSNPGNIAFGILPVQDVWTEWWEVFGKCVQFNDLPDHLNDLNAMREAEKVLNPEQSEVYRKLIFQIATGTKSKVIMHLDKPVRRQLFHDTMLATAAQRAKAFLLTLNLYTS